jgi:hypothetical protein
VGVHGEGESLMPIYLPPLKITTCTLNENATSFELRLTNDSWEVGLECIPPIYPNHSSFEINPLIFFLIHKGVI